MVQCTIESFENIEIYSGKILSYKEGFIIAPKAWPESGVPFPEDESICSRLPFQQLLFLETNVIQRSISSRKSFENAFQFRWKA
jgi:hypothetical protein